MLKFALIIMVLAVGGCAHQDFWMCQDANGKWVHCDSYNPLSGPSEGMKCYDSKGHEIPCVEEENCDMDMPHGKEV